MGDDIQLLDSLTREVANDPMNAGSHFRRGGCLERLGKAKDAFDEYSAALALAGETERIRFLSHRAQFCLTHSEFGKQAITDFDNLLKLKNGEHRFSVAKAIANLAYGDLAAGVTQLEAELDGDQIAGAVEYEKWTRCLHSSRDIAVEEVQASDERGRGEWKHLSKSYRRRSQMLREMESLQLALGDLVVAISLDPKNVDAIQDRAELFEELEVWKMAIADWSSYLANGGSEPGRGLKGRARVLFQLDKVDEAIKYLDEAQELCPDDAHIYWLKGCCFQSQDKYEAALTNLKKAIDVAKQTQKHGELTWQQKFWNLDCGKAYLGLKDYQRAADCHTLFLRTAEGQERLPGLVGRGYVYLAAEKWDAALADFRDANNLEHGSSHSKIGEVTTLMKMSKLKEALVELDSVISFDRKNKEAFLLRADCHRQLDNLTAAEADRSSAAQIIDSDDEE